MLQPALGTCAALGLSRPLIDEGPQIIHLAKGCTTSAAANVRDFALSLAE